MMHPKVFPYSDWSFWNSTVKSALLESISCLAAEVWACSDVKIIFVDRVCRTVYHRVHCSAEDALITALYGAALLSANGQRTVKSPRKPLQCQHCTLSWQGAEEGSVGLTLASGTVVKHLWWIQQIVQRFLSPAQPNKRPSWATHEIFSHHNQLPKQLKLTSCVFTL